MFSELHTFGICKNNFFGGHFWSSARSIDHAGRLRTFMAVPLLSQEVVGYGEELGRTKAPAQQHG